MNMNNVRIKLPGQCCTHCGKSYKKRENLDKHILFCGLIHSSKKIVLDDEEVVIPSAKNMYLMLVELGKKYNHLEERMSEMTKWVSKKKKKINVIEWLNTNVEPKIVFDNLWTMIDVIESDATSILEKSFNDVLHDIFARSFCNLEDKDKPIFAFGQKVNSFYIYQMLEQHGRKGWVLASREKLSGFFNKIHRKLTDVFYSWKKLKFLEVGLNKEKFEMACDKAILKLMNVDFRVESIFSKTNSILFHELKTDMKALVEYEFHF